MLAVCLILLAGCGDNSETDVTEDDTENSEKSNVSINFGEIDVKVEGNTVEISGDVKSEEDVFYYTLEQDDVVLAKEQEIRIGEREGGWSTFELESDLSEADLEDEEVPIIKLYAKDKNQVINPHFIPIDVINY